MQPCACRDCMEISAAGVKIETEEIYNAESEDYDTVTTVTLPMCWACEDAGCVPNGSDDTDTVLMPSYTYDCQRADAYDPSRP